MNFIIITLKIDVTTNQNCYSQTLIVSYMELKLMMSMKILAVKEICLILVTVQLSILRWSNKLVIGKMKDETGGAAIEEFIWLKAEMHSFFVDDDSEHRKVTCVNINVAATISHNEYKDVLLKNKCLRHSMNRI